MKPHALGWWIPSKFLIFISGSTISRVWTPVVPQTQEVWGREELTLGRLHVGSLQNMGFVAS